MSLESDVCITPESSHHRSSFIVWIEHKPLAVDDLAVLRDRNIELSKGSPPLGTLKQFRVPSHEQPAVREANGHSFPIGAFNNLSGLTLQIHLVLPKRRFGNESHPIAHSGISVGLFSLFHLLHRGRSN
jgi:hypothetical protein